MSEREVLAQLDAIGVPVGTTCLLVGAGAAELEMGVRERVGVAGRLVVADGELPGSRFDLAVVTDGAALGPVVERLWAGGTLVLDNAGPDAADRLAGVGLNVAQTPAGAAYGKVPRFATGH